MLRRLAALLVFTAWVSVPMVFATCAYADNGSDSLHAFHVDNVEMHAVDAEERAGVAEWNMNPSPRNIGTLYVPPEPPCVVLPHVRGLFFLHDTMRPIVPADASARHRYAGMSACVRTIP